MNARLQQVRQGTGTVMPFVVRQKTKTVKAGATEACTVVNLENSNNP